MEVGTIVKLNVDCLGNPKGTIGVVFYKYDKGFQAIFKNGEYDGFSTVNKMPDKQTEAHYFLTKVGFEPSLSGYQFKNVLRVSDDYDKGIFDAVLKREDL